MTSPVGGSNGRLRKDFLYLTDVTVIDSRQRLRNLSQLCNRLLRNCVRQIICILNLCNRLLHYLIEFVKQQIDTTQKRLYGLELANLAECNNL